MKRLTAFTVLVFFTISAFSFADQPDNGDVNCDEGVDLLDILHLIQYKYKDGDPPCPFISPGVAYAHWNSRTIDVGESWQNMAFFRVHAPDAGWVKVEFSHYVTTEAYCLQYEIVSGVPRDNRDESTIISFTSDQPISWNQIFYVSAGITEFSLNVKYCPREEEKGMITFTNINFIGTYFPEYYGDR